jgi:uncharacterized membrane protein
MDREEIKNRNDAMVYTAASALGIIAGMRSMTAPAVVAYIAKSGCTGADPEEFGLLGRPSARTATMILAGAEAIADKLPFMPRRTQTAALLGRLAIGAACGATICSVMRRSKVLGAIAGAFGALGSTFAVYQIRLQITQELGVPDTAVALLEDATAVWAGKAICQGLSLAGGLSKNGSATQQPLGI